MTDSDTVLDRWTTADSRAAVAPAAAAAAPGPSADAGARPHGRVRALDGLRGIAVVMVVAYHFAPDAVPAGFIGVDLFFVLSGFLITSLALGEHRRTGSFSTHLFYGRRARRLLPAAVVTVVVTVILAVVLQPDSTRPALRGQAVASLLYGANWWSVAQGDSYQAAFGAESPLSHFWSLAVEEQFYLFFPLLVLGGVVLLRRSGAGPRALAGVLLAASTAIALGSSVLMAVLADPTVDPSRLYFGTDTRLHSVLLGVAGAAAVARWGPGGAQPLRPGPSRPPSSPVDRVAAGVLPALALVTLVVVCLRGHLRDPWLYHFGFGLVAVLALVVVVFTATTRSPVRRVLEVRGLCVLGVASYSIYLWHWPVRVFVTTAHTGLTGWALLGARTALTALAAGASYLLVERRGRGLRPGPALAAGSLVGVALALAVVWVVARPVAATGTSTAAPPEAVTPPSAAAAPPLRVLWLGDSVAWTIGGGHFDYPDPVGFDSPFDPTAIVLWNKADYSCPLVRTPKRSFGLVKEKTGWCVERETTWPALIDQFHPDVVAWSGGLFDTYPYRVDGRWLEVATPEWDQLYLDSLEQARAVATARGARLVLVGQADPVGDPSQTEQESLLPENLWRWGHLRDLQRRFAATHLADTAMVDLQPIVCPGDSCAGLSLDHPGLREDGVHFWHGTIAPLAPRIQEALVAAAGRPS